MDNIKVNLQPNIIRFEFTDGEVTDYHVVFEVDIDNRKFLGVSARW